MCPVCLTTAALIAAGTTSTGGIASFLALKFAPARKTDTAANVAAKVAGQAKEIQGERHE
jgi:hypothetical protein